MEQHIIQIISQIKDDEQLVKDLNEHSNIMEDGGLDSLQMINFILKVEEQFGIEIDLEEFEFSHMESIAAFCQYISKYEKKANEVM